MKSKGKLGLLLALCLALGQTALAAEHLAVVEKDGKQGAIDPEGKVVIPLEFKSVEVNDKVEAPVVLVKKSGKYGLYDRNGKELLKPVLKKVTGLNEGYFGGKEKKTWSCYNLNGEKQPGEYEEVGLYQEGLAPVKVEDRWGFVDTQGKLVIPAQYKSVRGFSEGLAAAKLNSKWLYIHKDGTPLIGASIKDPRDFHQGVAVVDDNWLMNIKGQKYAKLRDYSFVGDFAENGLAEVGVRRRHRSLLDYVSIGWGWDGWGVWGYPGWGWTGGYHHRRHHGWGWGGGIGISPGAVMPGSLYRGYVNKQGQEVIPTTYDTVTPFYGSYALIQDEGHWGMVNAQGRVVIPPAYDALWPFSQGLAAFSFDKKWGFINEQNTVVISNRYDRVNSFLEDRTTVMTQEEGGIIDKQGQLAAPLRRQLKELGPLYADRAAFKDPAKDLWGYVNRDAQVVIPAQYDKAGIFD